MKGIFFESSLENFVLENIYWRDVWGSASVYGVALKNYKKLIILLLSGKFEVRQGQFRLRNGDVKSVF